MKSKILLPSLSLVAVSCATGPSQNIYEAGDILRSSTISQPSESYGQLYKRFKDKVAWTPNEGFGSAVGRHQDNSLAQDRAAFNYYCSNGRQKRSLKISFVALLGGTPSGMSLDRAQKVRSHKLKKARFYIKHFLKKQVHGGIERPFSNPNYIDDGEHFSKIKLYGNPYSDPSQYMTAANQKPVSCMSRWKNRKLQEKWINKGVGCYDPTFLLFDEKKYGSQLVMTFSGVPEFIWEKGRNDFGDRYPVLRMSNHELDEKGVALSRYPASPNVKGNIFGYVKEPPIKATYFRNPLKYEDERSFDIFPVIHLYSLEIDRFSTRFTMLIPRDTEKQFFSDLHLNGEIGHNFQKRNGSFDLSTAVENRAHLWLNYLERAVTVKEARTSNPSTVKYQATVDLNLFCKYGRPINDLSSK